MEVHNLRKLLHVWNKKHRRAFVSLLHCQARAGKRGAVRSIFPLGWKRAARVDFRHGLDMAERGASADQGSLRLGAGADRARQQHDAAHPVCAQMAGQDRVRHHHPHHRPAAGAAGPGGDRAPRCAGRRGLAARCPCRNETGHAGCATEAAGEGASQERQARCLDLGLRQSGHTALVVVVKFPALVVELVTSAPAVTCPPAWRGN